MYHRLTGLLAAGNYFVRYLFGAAGTAACVPAIEMIGVGWFSTLTSILVVFSTGGVYLTVLYGRSWREKIESRKTVAL